MAFGTIQVVETAPSPVSRPKRPSTPAPSRPKGTPAPAASVPSGQGVVEIAVVAPTLAEADDLLCGVYFNLEQLLSGSDLSVYTRDLAVITRLVEIKQDLETRCTAPVGRESLRTVPEGSAPLNGALLTVGESGRQTVSLDLRFRCVTPAALSTVSGADAVWVLLGQDESARRLAETAARQTADRSVFWLVAGFENKFALLANDPSQALGARERKEMCAGLGVPRTPGEHVGFVQLYGGLEFVRRDSEGAVVRTHQRHREYTPAACHLPVYTAVRDAMSRRPELNAACGGLLTRLQTGFAPWLEQWDSWCETCTETRREADHETQI